MPNEVMVRKRLIDYLPPFMQDFAEIKAIMRTGQPELDQAWLDIQIPLEDAFIMDCDGDGLKKYERFVGAIPDPGDSIDVRKARVLVYWNNFIPYTYRVLARRLNSLCGAGNYELSGSLERYGLVIKTGLMLGGQVQSLGHLLLQMVPMNMDFSSENEFTCTINGFLGCPGCICSVAGVSITSDFKGAWDLPGTLMARGAVGNIAALQVSSDQGLDVEAAGDEKSAAFAVYATGNISEPMGGTVSVEIKTSEGRGHKGG